VSSKPRPDPGNKYTQRADDATPRANVLPLARADRKGHTHVRMEDYALVDAAFAQPLSHSAPTHRSRNHDEALGHAPPSDNQREQEVADGSTNNSNNDNGNGNDNNNNNKDGDSVADGCAAVGALLVAVADGHGSVSLRESAMAGGSTHYVGGYECARLAARSAARYVHDVMRGMRDRGLSMADLRDEGVHLVLADAFAFAQRQCQEHTAMGARVIDGDPIAQWHQERSGSGSLVGGSNDTARALTAESADHHAQAARQQRLVRSQIDGAFFALLAAEPPHPGAGSAQRPWTYLADDKWLVPYRAGVGADAHGRYIVCYHNRARLERALAQRAKQGRSERDQDRGPGADAQHSKTPPSGERPPHLVPAEYGATLTVLLLVDSAGPGQPPAVHVANAGDSDAYLFRREARPRPDGGDDDQAPHDSQPYSVVVRRLTTDHSPASASERERLRPFGMEFDGARFQLKVGPFCEYAIMPSRACGHTLLSLHGITARPDCTSVDLHDGDLIVVASDGLWSDLGHSAAQALHGEIADGAPTVQMDSQRLSNEDSSAAVVAEVLEREREAGVSDPDQLAEAIMRRLVELVPRRRDNTVLLVIRVDGPS
jgi:serine/threonine protein phosphatase PrpC